MTDSNDSRITCESVRITGGRRLIRRFESALALESNESRRALIRGSSLHRRKRGRGMYFEFDIPTLLGTEEYEPENLEDAIRFALRGARAYGTWDTEWWDYSPRGCVRRVRTASRAVVEEQYGIVVCSEQVESEEKKRCEATVVKLLELARSDVRYATGLVVWAAENPEDELAAEALSLYLGEEAA